MAKNKISISFPEKNLHLFTYLKSKDNISNYICNLIEADMSEDNTDPLLEAKIQKIIDKLLRDKQLVATTSSGSHDVIISEDILTSDDIDTIKGLF